MPGGNVTHKPGDMEKVTDKEFNNVFNDAESVFI